MALAREVLASAWSQPVASLVTITIVAGMCASVLLTTGRTVGAEQNVLESIDSAGTRSILIQADSDAGLKSNVLGRIANVDGVEWSGAFGSAFDVQNSLVPEGTKVPLRLFYTEDPAELGMPAVLPVPNLSVLGSEEALTELGLVNASGGVTATVSKSEYAVVGGMVVPDFLEAMEPVLLAPQVPHGASSGDQANAPVTLLVVIASTSDLVAPVSQAVLSVLALDDPSKVKVSTSAELAALRATIKGQLNEFGRSLIVVVFGLTAILVAAILFGLVSLRRKDFGRRRALGASQTLIVSLLLGQIAALSTIGSIIGCIAAAVALVVAEDPLPSLSFFTGVGTLAVVTGLAAALLPALSAARRDPLKELRVP